MVATTIAAGRRVAAAIAAAAAEAEAEAEAKAARKGAAAGVTVASARRADAAMTIAATNHHHHCHRRHLLHRAQIGVTASAIITAAATGTANDHRAVDTTTVAARIEVDRDENSDNYVD